MLASNPQCWQLLQFTHATGSGCECSLSSDRQGIRQHPGSHLSVCRGLGVPLHQAELVLLSTQVSLHSPPHPAPAAILPLTRSPRASLGALAGSLCDPPAVKLLVLHPWWGDDMQWPGRLLSVARQWVRGCLGSAQTQVNVGNGAFGPGSGLSWYLGTFSSRGALIGFAVAPVAPGTCDAGWRPSSISSFGYVCGPGTPCHRGDGCAGLSPTWVEAAAGPEFPWEVAAIPCGQRTLWWPEGLLLPCRWRGGDAVF